MPSRRTILRLAGLAGALVSLAMPAAAGATANSYSQRNLVSDIPGRAMLHDAHLVNPWGLAAGPTTPLWVANNGTSTATIYSGDVNGMPVQKVPLVVHVASEEPTGQVFNGTTGFVMHVAGTSTPARFIFATQAGDIAAWPFTSPPQTTARVVAHVAGASFTGLALADVQGRGPLLYALTSRTAGWSCSTGSSAGPPCVADSATQWCPPAGARSTFRRSTAGSTSRSRR